MCEVMNRSFFSVILGGTAAAGATDDAAFVACNAETVAIVPGYGLAVARAQHAVKELATKLIEKGVNVKYAIHPVAAACRAT